MGLSWGDESRQKGSRGMRNIFRDMIEFREAKRVMAQTGWHSSGRSLSEDIEALATAWSAAERKASLIDHVERVFDEDTHRGG